MICHGDITHKRCDPLVLPNQCDEVTKLRKRESCAGAREEVVVVAPCMRCRSDSKMKSGGNRQHESMLVVVSSGREDPRCSANCSLKPSLRRRSAMVCGQLRRRL
jgi:hypothetical protein